MSDEENSWTLELLTSKSMVFWPQTSWICPILKEHSDPSSNCCEEDALDISLFLRLWCTSAARNINTASNHNTVSKIQVMAMNEFERWAQHFCIRPVITGLIFNMLGMELEMLRKRGNSGWSHYTSTEDLISHFEKMNEAYLKKV